MTVTIDHRAARQEPRLVEILALTHWRKSLAETVPLLALATLLQRWLGGLDAIPGVPHPYWLPVLLAASQYGMSAGLVTTIAASLLYWLELSPASAAQDYYAYAGSVAVQPALWLATVLVLGGLRNLHLHQSEEIVDQLAASERRETDLSGALERALAEINALEQRIAADMSSVAALSRALSLLDLSDRHTAAATYAEVFRAGTGATAVTIYLREPDAYFPVYEKHAVGSAAPMELPPMAIDRIIIAAERSGDGELSAQGLEVVRVPPAGFADEPLAAIVCRLSESHELRIFRRRADDLSRTLATILAACPGRPGSEASR